MYKSLENEAHTYDFKTKFCCIASPAKFFNRNVFVIVSDKGKHADHCNTQADCPYKGFMCDPTEKKCLCRPELPATNHLDKCGKCK